MKIEEAGERREAGGAKEPSTFHLKPSTKRSAFTLIEMIGVMALIAILAAVVVPPLFRTLEDGQSVNEDANLEAIAQALVRGIQAYGRFPNPNVGPDDFNNGWFTLAKNFYPKGINQLRYVYPKINNSAETERRVYLEPILVQNLTAAGSFSTPSTGFSATADLDGNQIPDFSQSLRMYVVSSSKRDLFLYCGKNQPNPAPQDAPTYGAALLSDLQNWVKEFEPPGTPNFGNLMVPQSIARWGTASGTQYRRGEYLHVKVVDLRPLFCKVELIDTACPPTATITTGDYTYDKPNVSLFGGVAVFDVFDSNLSPITPARALNNTDRVILRTPYPEFLDRATVLTPARIPGGTPGMSEAQATPALNPQPRFRIPISGSATPPPSNMFLSNIRPFYVIKGTSLQLWDSSSASPVLTITIESDCTFRFFGNTWSRLD